MYAVYTPLPAPAHHYFLFPKALADRDKQNNQLREQRDRAEKELKEEKELHERELAEYKMKIHSYESEVKHQQFFKRLKIFQIIRSGGKAAGPTGQVLRREGQTGGEAGIFSV